MLTGKSKKKYQRGYMRDYMRRKRAGLNETMHTFEPLNVVDMKVDAEGNLIPEY